MDQSSPRVICTPPTSALITLYSSAMMVARSVTSTTPTIARMVTIGEALYAQQGAAGAADAAGAAAGASGAASNGGDDDVVDAEVVDDDDKKDNK